MLGALRLRPSLHTTNVSQTTPQPEIAALIRALAPRLPPDPNIQRLLRQVGSPTFYDTVATVDVGRRADWQEMSIVQQAFHDAERHFDPTTKAYSESMRLTLHAAVLLHMADPAALGRHHSLFEAFLELHVTAFSENGGWFDNMQIPWRGAVAVGLATPTEMLWRGKDLLDGIHVHDEKAVLAAELVRAARAAT